MRRFKEIIKRIATLGMSAVLMASTLTVPVHAVSGAITVNNKLVIKSSNKSAYDNKTLTGTYNPLASDFANDERGVIIIDGVTVSLTINDLNISVTEGGSKTVSGILLKNNATLNLTLTGSNSMLAAGNGAGICVTEGSTLNITKESTGSLKAEGGCRSGSTSAGGAGIGAEGGNESGLGAINIKGGTITAIGGSTRLGMKIGAAGIGASFNSKATGSINISGGNVTAKAYYGNAAIGGAYSECVKSITISGGTVTATVPESNIRGASIGCGANGSTQDKLSCGTIKITGGKVTANGNIGYGDGGPGVGYAGGSVTINPDATDVTCTGNVLAGKVDWKAWLTFDANGGSGTMERIAVPRGAYTVRECTFTPPTGKSFWYWDIDGSYRRPGETIEIKGDTVFKAKWQDASIFTFDANGGSGTMAPVNTYHGTFYVLPFCSFTPPTGKVFSHWEMDGKKYRPGSEVSGISSKTVKAVWEDKITWKNNICIGEDTTIDERVQVEGSAELEIREGVTLTIPKGIHVKDGNSLTIKGSGILKIEGVDSQNAGIGGDGTEACGTVIIEGCTITAKGGSGAAGIGGGQGGSGGTITIKGGTVNANGGSDGDTINDGRGGAGIGGGSRASSGNITITGGTVNANGNDGSKGYNNTGITYCGGAGIGAGFMGSIDSITISGGNVFAQAGGISCAIGAGYRNGGGTITISGGQVTAKASMQITILENVKTEEGYNTTWKGVINPMGIGAGTEGDPASCTIRLGWSKSTDYVSALPFKVKPNEEDNRGIYSGKVTFTRPFTLEDGTTTATADNINNAKIIPKGCISVIFDANGHGTAPEEIGVQSGEKITKPEDPKAAGYAFGGWYKEAACKNAYDFNDTVTAGFTLYAKWTALPAVAPAISTQPAADTTLKWGYGLGGTLEVLATADSGADYDLTYQWYSNTGSSTTGGSAVSGATKSYFAIPTGLAVNTHYYYCVVTAKRKDNNEKKTTTSRAAAVKVEKGDAKVGILSDSSISVGYGDGPFTLQASAVTGTGGKWTWKSSDTAVAAITSGGSTANPTITVKKKTGSTPVKITVSYSSQTTVGSAEISLTVTDTPVYIAGISAESKVYDKTNAVTLTGTPVLKTVSKDAVVKDVTISNITAEFDDVNAGGAVAVTVKDASISDTVNYTLSIPKTNEKLGLKAEITPKEVALNWENTRFTYNGNVLCPTASVDDSSLIEGDTCTVTKISGGQKNAGKYTATATELSNANYKLPDNPVMEFEIEGAAEEPKEPVSEAVMVPEPVEDATPRMELDDSKLVLKANTTSSAIKADLFLDSIASVTIDKPNVASVSFSGDTIYVKAGKNKGKAVATVTSTSGIVKRFNIEVQTSKVTTKKLNIKPSAKKYTLNGKGATKIIYAEAVPDYNSTGEKLTVKSSKNSVAIAVADPETGKVTITAVGKGNANVTVSAGKKKQTIKVTVKAPVPVTGVKLNKTEKTLKVKGSLTLKATLTPKKPDNTKVTWTVDKPDVVKIKGNKLSCKVTAHSPGEATITVTTADGSYTSKCKITVKPKKK